MKAQILRILTIALTLLGLNMLAQPHSASAATWGANNYGQTTFNVTIVDDGQSSNINPRFTNTGTRTWYNYLSNQVSINYMYERYDSGTGWDPNCNGGDGCYQYSAFSCNSWVNDHRPDILNQSSRPSGSVGDFTFRFCNNNNKSPGTYTEHYAVAHGSEWMPNGSGVAKITVRITVLPPAPPTPTLYNISNSDSDGNYTVSWSTASGATSYQLQERFNSGSWNTIYTGGSRNKSRSGRSPGTWCYRVLASNTGGDSNWSSNKCTTVLPPAPPTPTLYNISNSDSDGNYTVNWSTASGATSYQLQERLNSGSWSTIYTGGSRSKSRSGRSPGTWCYRVLASNTGGDSNWSSNKCTTVLPPAPPTPTLDNISNSDGDGNYTVNWSIASGATSYQLQERFNSGSWRTIYTGSSRSKSRSGRSPGTWCYRVLASNTGGNSQWSSNKCTTVLPPAPSTPTLDSISNSDGNYTVNWSIAPGATSYQLQEQFNSGNWSDIYTGPNTNQELSGRSPGKSCYRVRASNTGGNSSWSSNQCTTVLPPAPPTPTLDSISNSDGDGNYTLSWSTASGATSYQLQEQLNSGNWSDIYTGPNTNQELSERSPGTWCYRVRASNTGGDSSWSSNQCTTVLPPAPPTPTLDSISNSDGNYTVNWSIAPGATSYQLQEQLNSGNWSDIYTGPNTNQELSERSPGKSCYRVRASNTGGNSQWSSNQCTTVEPADLTVSTTETGSGIVTSEPDGIDCGTDCSEPYDAGTVVTLTASPASGWLFVGWRSEHCSGTSTCTVTMDGSKSVTAEFAIDEPAPVPDFTASSTSGTAPLTVVFSDTSTNEVTEWRWEFGDGITSTLQHPTHTYSEAGTYTVTLTVNGPGGTDTLTRSNYITVTASASSSIEASVTLEGRPTPPNTRWVVPLNVSLTIPGEQTPAHEFTPTTDENGNFTLSNIEPGTYEVRVKKSTALQKMLPVTLMTGSNSIDLGILQEGDANDDNLVSDPDFEILAATFGKCESTTEYDGRADFNADSCVTLNDFSLLAANFGQGGE